MGSADKGKEREEIEECRDIPSFSASERVLLSDEDSKTGFVGVIANRMKLLKFGSASAKFKRMAEERDEVSRSVGSSSGHGIRERINNVIGRKIDWPSLLKIGKKWIRNPMNLAVFLWITCVAVSGAILFLVMTGMLNHALPKKSQRDTWFEVNNQILNALFTLMCLYQHPKRFYHLILLCRWKAKDILRLRKIYCKNGTYKPHEWAHMMVVVMLLHLNCFAQYALCGLNLGYKRSERPAIGVGITISFAIGAPAAAGIYSMISPLGKDYESEVDEEAQIQVATESKTPDRLKLMSLEKRYSFTSGEEQKIESRPAWSGGILDFWDDISLAYLSLCCTFCVFGWNMERLGFGNMYVHIITFMLFCFAPFWIFDMAAVNIDNETVRVALGVTGIVLCAFGLLYGGFWRIQMRKRFNLPGYNFCCGRPAIADCTLWLFCCWCSLAQEVRTGNSYDIIEDKFYKKRVKDSNQLPPTPLPREGMSMQFNARTSSPQGSNSSQSNNVEANYAGPCHAVERNGSPGMALPKEMIKLSVGGKDETMIAPTPSLIRRDAL